MTSLSEARKVKEEFWQEYQVLGQYISGVGITQMPSVEREIKNRLEAYCITVRLSKPLPQGLSIPTNYKGVLVETKGVGEIKAREESQKS